MVKVLTFDVINFLIFNLNMSTMKKISLFILALFTSLNVLAVELGQETLDKIFASSFEVVVPKPIEGKGPVVYGRELPLHLLPYQFRNDKYFSVGSAFRIDDNKFVSAAHVVNLGYESQDKDISIRDTNGNIYPIDKVLKYSGPRDFIVFTVKGLKDGVTLGINTDYSKNKKVYAVGNALGEGVVIRDGLYTSDTPEEEEGQWKWIRFSAAASPGNSGGPLLDDKGQAIGVILRKSENENLNYALPIREVLEFDNIAQVKSTTAIYKIDYSNDTHSFSFNRKHKLPMKISKLDKLLQKEMNEIFEKAADDFLKENKSKLFPNDPGSLPILYNRFSAAFPSILYKGNDNIWDIYVPQDVETSDTGDGGQVRFGKMGNFYYAKIKRPDNIDKKLYYSDTRLVMDQILKGTSYSRTIGPESIPVLSLGKALHDSIHVDDYGRKWQVRKWLVDFSDQKFVLYMLPTPDGYVTMMSLTYTGAADMMEIDMKIIINNLYYSYYGTLDDWSGFISMKGITPEFVNNIKIESDQKSFIQYKDKHFELKIDKDVMEISKDSAIQLRCSYYLNKDKVVWEPIMVLVGEHKNVYNYASVSRNIRPPKSLDERYKSRWLDIINRRTPYNYKTYTSDQTSNLTMVKANYPDALDKNEEIYALSWHEEGDVEHSVMESKVKKIANNFRVINQ